MFTLNPALREDSTPVLELTAIVANPIILTSYAISLCVLLTSLVTPPKETSPVRPIFLVATMWVLSHAVALIPVLAIINSIVVLHSLDAEMGANLHVKTSTASLITTVARGLHVLLVLLSPVLNHQEIRILPQ